MDCAVLGTTPFTVACAQALAGAGARIRALVTLPPGLLPLNPADVAGCARRLGVPCLEFASLDEPAAVERLGALRLDWMFSTWPHLLGPAALAIPRLGTIGTHVASLPRHRGRHPLHWTIVLGLPATHLSFFRMDAGVDSGDLLLQVPIAVRPDDTVATLAESMHAAGIEGCRRLVPLLDRDPPPRGQPQDHSQATTWRKRTPHDVTIDPRMGVDLIRRIVRSFAPPYPCAKLIVGEEVLAVARAEAVAGFAAGTEHGTVVACAGHELVMACDDGLVRLTCREPIPPSVARTRAIHPPSRYLVRRPDLLPEG